MAEFSLDKETFLVYPLFGLGTAASLGLVEANFLPFIDLGETLVEVGTIEWTIGRLMSLAALAAVVINRDNPLDFDGWGVLEVWVLYVTVGLIIAPPFFPAFEGWLAETPAAFIAFTAQSIGFGLISWIN